MTLPTLEVTWRFATGPAFGSALVLGDPATPLGVGVLGTNANRPIDITADVQRVSLRRGRTRIIDQFEAGTGVVEIRDLDGTYDPQNGPYAGQILPLTQVQVRATWAGTEYLLFSGYTESIDYRYEPGAEISFLTLTCVDAFRLFYLSEIDSVAGTSAGDLPGARLAAILDSVSWPSGLRNIDTGSSPLLDDDGTERTVLGALQTVELAEFGSLFMTPGGIVRFIDRENTIKRGDATPWVFDDDGTDLPYAALGLSIDDTLLANSIGIAQEGGSSYVFQDSTSIDAFFERTLDRGALICQNASDVESQGRALLAARKDPFLRADAIGLSLARGDNAQTTAALDAELLDPVQIYRTHPGSGRVSLDLSLQGIAHDIVPGGDWVTTFSLAEPVVSGFILGSATAGVLGSDVLAY